MTALLVSAKRWNCPRHEKQTVNACL